MNFDLNGHHQFKKYEEKLVSITSHPLISFLNYRSLIQSTNFTKQNSQKKLLPTLLLLSIRYHNNWLCIHRIEKSQSTERNFIKRKRKNKQSPPENPALEAFCFGFLVWALAEAAEIFLVVPAAISYFFFVSKANSCLDIKHATNICQKLRDLINHSVNRRTGCWYR